MAETPASPSHGPAPESVGTHNASLQAQVQEMVTALHGAEDVAEAGCAAVGGQGIAQQSAEELLASLMQRLDLQQQSAPPAMDTLGPLGVLEELYENVNSLRQTVQRQHEQLVKVLERRGLSSLDQPGCPLLPAPSRQPAVADTLCLDTSCWEQQPPLEEQQGAAELLSRHFCVLPEGSSAIGLQLADGRLAHLPAHALLRLLQIGGLQHALPVTVHPSGGGELGAVDLAAKPLRAEPGKEAHVNVDSRNLRELPHLAALGTVAPAALPTKAMMKTHFFSSVLPGSRSADSGIWAAGVLAGGLSSVHTALVVGTEDGESGEAFGLVARSSSLPAAKRKVVAMRLPALRSLSARLRLLDGFAMYLFCDALAAAALHRVFKYAVTAQLGAEAWQALEAQGKLHFQIFKCSMFGQDASGSPSVVTRRQMLEVLAPTPEVDRLLDDADLRAAERPVVQRERPAVTLSQVVWDPAQQPAEGAAPQLPAWAAVDPGAGHNEAKACFAGRHGL